ncbi:hypothetical protein R5O24_03815 [Tenacibaculum maritimum]|uniref:hypothetical protein n=1 Tax=Tenacibaculum maritimum TaxID=107401 RepID=UPI0038908D60
MAMQLGKIAYKPIQGIKEKSSEQIVKKKLIIVNDLRFFERLKFIFRVVYKGQRGAVFRE